MATENAIMAAVLAKGETIVGHAACEPHIQDLCRFLVSLGARIEGIGSNILRIDGVDAARRAARTGSAPSTSRSRASPRSPPTTGGERHDRGRRARRPHLDRARLSEARDRARGGGDDRARPARARTLHVVDDLGGQIPKIESGIWPAFPADLTSIAVVAATQARGTVLVFEKMFESRLFFVDKLVSMGARIILCDPHRVVVTGPAQLFGQRLESPDIRAGMAMVIAALCAEGALDDRQHRPDRPRLRADRRAPARPRRRRSSACEL